MNKSDQTALFSIITKLHNEIQEELPNGLLAHTYRVAQNALWICTKSPQLKGKELSIWIACLAHDRFRHLSLESQANLLTDKSVLKAIPSYAIHGYLAAEHLAKNYQITDLEVLNACQNHTLLGPTLSDFSACVFMADKLDPLKKYFDGQKVLASLSSTNFWETCLLAALQHRDRFASSEPILLSAINDLSSRCAKS